MMRMKNLPHPGAFIRSEIIEAHELSVTDGAKVLGVTRQALSDLVNCKASLSPDMAVRLEKAFGVSMETLLRMQGSYEIAQARARAPQIDVKPYQASTAAPAAMSSTAEPSLPQTGPQEVSEPAPSVPGAAPKRPADHPDHLAWEARMLAGAERLARDEDARRESGKRLW